MRLSDFDHGDANAVDRIAVAAFEELKDHYDDWPAMAANLGRMSRLAESGEIIVAVHGDRVVGAVAYIPPGRPKAGYFDQGWPVIRMLVVDPACRGLGAGRALTSECIRRAVRDQSPIIALHTSPIMTVALPMYLRMGFELVGDAPPIHGAPYSVYLKRLEA